MGHTRPAEPLMCFFIDNDLKARDKAALCASAFAVLTE